MYYLLYIAVIPHIICHDIKGFDDTILFDINWPGPEIDRLGLGFKHMVIKTKFQEQYQCYLPNIQEKEPALNDNYEGPTPLELISPLFSQTACSYRLESYWTYEVCHGRYIRQYHEDREGKKVKLQEYVLGLWDKSQYERLLVETRVKDSKNLPLPMKKIDGVSLPYFELSLSNGTLCVLNHNKPRETKVIYVCYIHGKHEVFSLKETSTCVYEVIILSPLLCTHPKYKPQETGENQINCLPLDDHPSKPRNLIKMRKEATKLRRRSDIDHIRLEFHPLDLNEKEELPKLPESSPTDTSPVENFLAGKNCLNGGTGWWKYEFCYGKSVEQYHIEKDGGKTAIKLGRFNKAKHIEWLASHPHKRAKPIEQRTQLSLLYSDGDTCDKTGKARQTEVKLKCLDNTSNLNAVSLYLLEPKYCEYILGVESPLICDILAKADENNLVANSDDDGIIEDEISTVNVIRV